MLAVPEIRGDRGEYKSRRRKHAHYERGERKPQRSVLYTRCLWSTFYRLRGRVPSHSGCGTNAVLFCQSPRAIPFKSQTTRPFRTVSSHTSFCRPSSRPPKLSTKPNFPFSILITEISAESPTEICPRSSCLISFAGFHVDRRTMSCTY